MTSAQRFVRQAVLVLPLVLVNAAAVYGQVQWATENLTQSGSIAQAVLFAHKLVSAWRSGRPRAEEAADRRKRNRIQGG